MILGVLTTKASVHEISNLEAVLGTVDLPKGVPLFAYKGYASQKNRALLRERGLKDGIMKRAVRGKALTQEEKIFNRCVSKVRYTI